MGRRFITISLDVLAALCVEGKVTAIKCVKGLPADARAVAARADMVSNPGRVDVVIESERWPETAEGMPLPREEVLFKTVSS